MNPSWPRNQLICRWFIMKLFKNIQNNSEFKQLLEPWRSLELLFIHHYSGWAPRHRQCILPWGAMVENRTRGIITSVTEARADLPWCEGCAVDMISSCPSFATAPCSPFCRQEGEACQLSTGAELLYFIIDVFCREAEEKTRCHTKIPEMQLILSNILGQNWMINSEKLTWRSSIFKGIFNIKYVLMQLWCGKLKHMNSLMQIHELQRYLMEKAYGFRLFNKASAGTELN